MKKNLLISLGIGATLINISYAQSPIITSTNQLHAIGDSTVYVDANSFGFDPIPAGGANINWNYASLVTSGGITFSYDDPTNADTSAYEFPTANEAMASSAAVGHEWFLSSSNSIKRLGYSNPSASAGGDIIYTNGGFVRYQFPFQAGDSWFTTSYHGTTTINFAGSDSTVVENGNYSASVDAYGTVVLPSGTVSNVVRVHVLESFDLNIYMFGTVAVSQALNDDYYFWFADNIKDPILIYGTTVSGSSTTTVLRYQAVGIITSTKENDFENIVKVYPNPSDGVFNISMSDLKNETYKLNVLNIVGEKVYSQTIKNNKEQINLSALNKGVYFLNVSNSKLNHTQKIIIK